MSRKRKKKAKTAAVSKPVPVADKPKQTLMGMEQHRPKPTIMYYSYTLYPRKKAKD